MVDLAGWKRTDRFVVSAARECKVDSIVCSVDRGTEDASLR
jgi:hypothetical protein